MLSTASHFYFSEYMVAIMSNLQDMIECTLNVGYKIKESMANESKVKAVLGALSSKLGRPIVKLSYLSSL